MGIKTYAARDSLLLFAYSLRYPLRLYLSLRAPEYLDYQVYLASLDDEKMKKYIEVP